MIGDRDLWYHHADHLFDVANHVEHRDPGLADDLRWQAVRYWRTARETPLQPRRESITKHFINNGEARCG